MPLILAIEPDKRQASKIASLARGPLHAELVVTDTAERAIAVLAERVPDLILTSMLLSPKDEAALADRLRELDAAGTRVQTLVIPVLGTTSRRGAAKADGGLLTRLRKNRSDAAMPDGCDPSVFAAQITEYLERAAAERRAASGLDDDAPLPEPVPTVRAPIESPEPTPPLAAAANVFDASAFFAKHSQSAALADAPADEELPEQLSSPEPTPAFSEPVRPYAFERDGEEVPVAIPERTFGTLFTSHAAPAVVDAAAPAVEAPQELATDAATEVSEMPVVFEPVGASDTVLAAPEDAPAEATAEEDEPEPWDEIVLEEPPRRVGRMEETFSDHVEPIEIQVESIDLASFVRELEGVAATAAPPAAPAADASVEEDPALAEFTAALAALTAQKAAAAAAAHGATEFDDFESTSDGFVADSDLWMPLPAATLQAWPRMEAPINAAHRGAHAATLAVATPVAVVDELPSVPAAPSRKPTFVNLLTSIRRDIEQLRAVKPPAAPPSAPEPAAGVSEPPHKAPPRQNGPVQDEWGFFDPERAGFAALLSKLEEITEKDPKSTKRRRS